MSNIKLKFFSSETPSRGGFMGKRYTERVEKWIEDNQGVEIIDYEIKVLTPEKNENTLLIIKYRDSNKRALMIEKEQNENR